MMTGIDRRRLLGAGCGASVRQTVGVPAADDVSRWDGDARSAVRLIAGSRPRARSADALRAGIEIRLKGGWHTYWRYPGDAGVPPQFDFGNRRTSNRSSAVAGAAAARGRRRRLDRICERRDHSLRSCRRTRQAGRAAAQLDYAICEKLCVRRSQAELVLIKEASSQDAGSRREARVPQKLALGKGGPLVICSVRREAGAVRPRIVVDLVLSAATPVDLFAEADAAMGAAFAGARGRCAAGVKRLHSISTGCAGRPATAAPSSR